MTNDRDQHPDNSDRRWFRSLRAWSGCLHEPIDELDAVVSALAVLAALASFFVFGWIVVQFVAALADPSGGFEAARNLGLTVAAFVGLPFLVWRSWVGERQARASLRQAETAEENVVTNSFTRAIDQLGATREVKEADGAVRTVPNLEVRLGALYALERLYRTSKKDKVAIAEIVAAYVRQNGGPPRWEQPEFPELPVDDAGQWRSFGEAVRALDPPREDVQTALMILCRSCTLRDGVGHSVDWRRLDATRADLRTAMKPGLEMSRAQLMGAVLEETDMACANLSGAILRGATLAGATLPKANLFMARLEAANLERTVLEGAVLPFARLQGANLCDARMEGADLRFANMSSAEVDRTDFARAVVYGAKFAFSRGLTQQQVDSVWEGDTATELPAGIDRPAHWPERKFSLDESGERLALHRAGKPPPGL